MATCKSCNAEIEWVESVNGKAMPMDLGAARTDIARGLFAVVNGKAHAYSQADRKLARDARTCHFATCPDAPDWRKK